MADPFPDPRRPEVWPGSQATRDQPRSRADARRVMAGQHPPSQRGAGRRAGHSRPSSRRQNRPQDLQQDPQRDLQGDVRPDRRPDQGHRGPPERRWDEPRRPQRPRRLWLRAVLPACAVLLAAWSATCLLDADLAVVALLAAATPATAVFAVPVLAVSVHQHRYLVAGLALAAAILPWALVAPYAIGGPGPPAARGARTLHVMTVNARLGGADAGEVVGAVRDRAVDVLVVTELTGPLAHRLTLAGLRQYLRPLWVDVSAAPAGGIGIWARDDGAQPPRAPGSVAPQQPATAPAAIAVPGTRWPAATTRVAFGGRAVTVTGVHVMPPGLGGSDRWHRDLEALRTALATGTGPRLLVGDLAATPWNAPFRRLADVGVQDAANVAGGGLRATWPAWSPVPVTALDHVLVGGGIAVRSVGTQRIGGTDHLALVATLAVPTR